MNVELFTPYKKQQEFIDAFADTDDLFGVVVSARGSGKSLLAMNLILYWLLSTPKQRGGYVAPTFSQAKSVLDQIVESAKDLVVSSNRMDATVSFINGSTLKFLSADSADNIRGFRFEYLIIDEAAYVKETTLGTTILPTLNPNGKKCLMVSTPKGKNHFFNWYNKPDVVSMAFPLDQCPYVSNVLVEEARRSLPNDLFRQEFLAEFVDSGNDVFVGIDKVSTVGIFSLQHRVDVFAGIDTGLTDDMSVLTLVDTTGRVRWIEAINNLPIQTIADRFIDTMKHFNIVGGYIETNGVGRGMYDLVSPAFKKIKAFNTTQDNKTEMVRKLIGDIESMNIELPSRDLCPQLHNEFSTYTYKMSTNGKLSFSHMPGSHDDYVDSLMLANYSRVQFINKRPISVRPGGSRVNSIKPRFGSMPS